MNTWRFMKRLSLILLIPLVGVFYIHLNHDNGSLHNLVTPLDNAIPFSPYFVIPYLFWFGFIFISLAWFAYRNKKLYYCSLISIVLGIIVSSLVYFLFQTTVPRPVIQGYDIFSQLTKSVYAVDNPYNTFPSIHVLTSYIIFLVAKQYKTYSKSITSLIQVMAILIILSTLFLKQHTLLDVAGGIFIGGILFIVIEHLGNLIYRSEAVDMTIKQTRIHQSTDSLLTKNLNSMATKMPYLIDRYDQDLF